jgi:hypothetical protein
LGPIIYSIRFINRGGRRGGREKEKGKQKQRGKGGVLKLKSIKSNIPSIVLN